MALIYKNIAESAHRPNRLSRGYKSPASRVKIQQVSSDSIDIAPSKSHQTVISHVQPPAQFQTTLLVQEKVNELICKKHLEVESGTRDRVSTLDRNASNITILNDFNSKDVNFIKEILPGADKYTAIKRRVARLDKIFRRKSLTNRSRMFTEELNTITMLNPDCFVQIILDFIYEQVGMDKSISLDLCDESGNMMKLDSYNKYDMATTLFEENKLYYVVEYELYEDGSYKLLLPVLRELTDEDTEVCINVRKNYSKRMTVSSAKSISKSRMLRISSAD